MLNETKDKNLEIYNNQTIFFSYFKRISFLRIFLPRFIKFLLNESFYRQNFKLQNNKYSFPKTTYYSRRSGIPSFPLGILALLL